MFSVLLHSMYTDRMKAEGKGVHYTRPGHDLDVRWELRAGTTIKYIKHSLHWPEVGGL